jgi:hypothetical protein
MSLVYLRHQALGAQLIARIHHLLQDHDAQPLNIHLRIELAQYVLVFLNLRPKALLLGRRAANLVGDLARECLFLLIEGVEYRDVDVLTAASDLIIGPSLSSPPAGHRPR